ncbi:MAG: hypothetical protein HQK49_01890 [Oligoflexia bacterium]|nr:hypothetical protein [Oligoflexia bacterium]
MLKKLVYHIGDNDNIRESSIHSMFKNLLNPDKHLSPTTIRMHKRVVIAFCKWLGLKNIEFYFSNIYIPTNAQLREKGICFKSKNREHLEREQVFKLVQGFLTIEDSRVKSSLFIQLWTGCMLQEACCAEFTESSIIIQYTYKNGQRLPLKTSSIGTNIITSSRDKFFDVYALLTECRPEVVNTKIANAIFQNIVKNYLGNKTKIDRYFLRHTALTWLCKSPMVSIKSVAEMAGHVGLGMLDRHYVKTPVKDNRTWDKVMPIYIDCLPDGWHGFLISCLIASKWRNLEELLNKGTPPEDNLYKEMVDILTRKKEERKKNFTTLR